MTRKPRQLVLCIVKDDPKASHETLTVPEAMLEHYVKAEIPNIVGPGEVVLLLGDGRPRIVHPPALAATAELDNVAGGDGAEVGDELEDHDEPQHRLRSRPTAAHSQRRQLDRLRQAGHLTHASRRSLDELDELDDRLLRRAMQVSDHLLGQVLKYPESVVKTRCVEESIHRQQLIEKRDALVQLAHGRPPPSLGPSPLQMLMNALCSAGFQVMMNQRGKGEPQ
ncbi:MAG: hypothetical protein R3A51_24045 [Nannocystaceae bacterium]